MQPWYQPRFFTCVVVILMLAGCIALNTWEWNKGTYRVYLDERETLCVAYDALARGWPETFSVRYVLNEHETTLMGYPRRKYLDDESNARSLWINLLLAFVAVSAAALVVESSLRMLPARKTAEPFESRKRSRMVSQVRPVSATQAARGEPASAAAAENAPATGPRPRSRPVSTKRPLSKTLPKPVAKTLPKPPSKLGPAPGGRPRTGRRPATAKTAVKPS